MGAPVDLEPDFVEIDLSHESPEDLTRHDRDGTGALRRNDGDPADFLGQLRGFVNTVRRLLR
jgi:hypothetical protein